MASGTYAKGVVRKWYNSFPSSDLFHALPPAFQRNARWTVEFFAELMADYMDDPPLSWNGEDVVALVIDVIPQKSMFEREIYEGFCPILRAFFEFLGRETIEKGWSEELVKSLAGKDASLLKNAKYILE